MMQTAKECRLTERKEHAVINDRKTAEGVMLSVAFLLAQQIRHKEKRP